MVTLLIYPEITPVAHKQDYAIAWQLHAVQVCHTSFWDVEFKYLHCCIVHTREVVIRYRFQRLRRKTRTYNPYPVH